MRGFYFPKRFKIRYPLTLAFLFIFFIQVDPLIAQEVVHYDSVKVGAGHYFSFGNQVIYCPRDTVLILADTIDYFQSRRDITTQSDKFYSKLKDRLANKDNRVSEALYKVTFGKDRMPNKEVKEAEMSVNSFLPYSNRLIGSLKIKKLDIFGTDIKDTTIEVHGTKKFLNRAHVKTNDRIIYNNLIINRGEVLKPVEVADNERIIRQLPFIKDAKIMVVRTEIPSPGVDMVVVTKDVFPLKFEIDPMLISDGQFGLSNINLFGTGHELETDLIVDDRGDRGLGHDTYLKVRNFKGSFVSTNFNIANSFSKEGAGIIFFRDFFTPNTVYAGGGEISRYTFREMRLANGQILSPLTEIDSAFELSSTQNTQDFWIGRSFKDFNNLPPFLDLKRWRLLTAARINRVRFTNRPVVTDNTNEIFHHRTRFLGSIGLSSRHYYKDAMVNFYGRTEDIPAGNLIQLTSGYEIGEFRNRTYFGLRVTKGDFITNIGYLRGEINTGGFFSNGHYEQGVVKTKISYFSRLFSYQFLKIRHFLKIEHTVGVRRSEFEIIDLDDPYGIRGFSSILHAGTKRFVINQESVFFTPVYLLGFRMATFSFMDLAFLKGSPFAGKVFSALGFGIRMRNENLAFNTIQLRLAYYPSPPIDMDAIGFTFATKIAEPVEDFDLREPNIVEFR